MQFIVLEKSKDSLSLQIEHPDDTLIYPLLNQLLKDEDVSDAKYNVGHPMLDKPVLLIRTRKGKPHTALKHAAEALSREFGEARAAVKKSVRKGA
jgi:DNA-directed RNA polymerase subunit L